MFRFANSEYLWLLLLIPAAILSHWLALRERRRRLARFGNPELLRELAPDVSDGQPADPDVRAIKSAKN